MSKVRPWVREAVYKRDNMQCRYCGVVCLLPAETWQGNRRMATMDHVIPEALGGRSTVGNLVVACFGCNNAKGMRQTYEPPPVGKLPDLVWGEPARELARRIVRGEC